MNKQCRNKRERRAHAQLSVNNGTTDEVRMLDKQGETILKTGLALVTLLQAESGACYRYAFLLRLFLKERYGMDGRAVVGFVNDGTDEVYASHGWYEFDGHRTDLALWKPLNPGLQPSGPLTIHGVQVVPGHPWSYHREMPRAGLRLLQLGLAHKYPAIVAMLRDQEQEHSEMKTRSENDRMMREFLDAAPDGLTYSRIADAVSRV